jgi:hypothetical protein
VNPLKYFSKYPALTQCLVVVTSVCLIGMALFFAGTRLFTISPGLLDQAATTQHVQFDDQKSSFTIVPQENTNPATGIIFYPGALTDAKAYAPKLAALSHATGIQVFIVKPHFRLANLNSNAAEAVMQAHPTIQKWYVGGHSMGGGAACSFSNQHAEQVQGLFLLAAYCSSQAKKFPGPTLVITGTNDKLEPLSKIQGRLPLQAKLVQIDGATHASFSNYGDQPFDGQQAISDPAMTSALTTALVSFIQ